MQHYPLHVSKTFILYVLINMHELTPLMNLNMHLTNTHLHFVVNLVNINTVKLKHMKTIILN